jgi:uncharacterized membrane protein YfcA
MTEAEGERTGLFVALGLALCAAAAVLIALRGDPIAPLWTIAVIGVPWAALTLFLRLNRETWGKELPYFDLWSITHVVAGFLLALLGIGLIWVFVLAVAWELIEMVAGIEEYPTNRVSDVIVAIAAWPAGQWLFSGDYRLW